MSDEKIEKLEKKIQKNTTKIDSNTEKIQQNTGALEILKTFKADSDKFFMMWLITFIMLLVSIGCIIFLLHR
jgi:hypothetical protein